MALVRFERGRSPATAEDEAGLQAKLPALFAFAVLPVGLLSLLVPRELLMPSASAACISLAAAVAVFAYRTRVNYSSPRLTFWDLAGALAFVGVAAGALSNPENVAELFGVTTN